MPAKLQQVSGYPVACDIAQNLCVGTTDEQVAIQAGLQRIINEFVKKRGGEEVTVDSIIGPKTFASSEKVLRKIGQPAPVDSQNLAVFARLYAEKIASSIGVTASQYYGPPPPPQRSPAPADDGLPQPLPPDASDEGSSLRIPKWIWWAGGLALVGVAGYFGWRYLQGQPEPAMAGGDEDFDYLEAGNDFIDV